MGTVTRFCPYCGRKTDVVDFGYAGKTEVCEHCNKIFNIVITGYELDSTAIIEFQARVPSKLTPMCPNCYFDKITHDMDGQKYCYWCKTYFNSGEEVGVK